VSRRFGGDLEERRRDHGASCSNATSSPRRSVRHTGLPISVRQHEARVPDQGRAPQPPPRAGIDDVREVKTAYLEGDGRITVIKNDR